MNQAGFSDDELMEAAALAEQDTTARQPPKKKSVKIFINPEKFKEDVSINPVDLQGCFMNQAALLAYYGMQLAKAKEQVDNIKLMRDVKEAEYGKEYRDQFLKDGIKPTESMVTSAINSDKRFIKIKRALNEARGVEEMIVACYEAFRHRRDMLVQMGAAAREEMKGETYIRSVETKTAIKEAQEDELRNRVRRMPGKQ